MNPLLNKTTRMIMPMAYYGEGDKGANILTTHKIVSAYIGDIDDSQYDDKILIVHTDGTKKAVEVPKDFVDDYWKIVCSQYQEVSRSYMEYVVAFWDDGYSPPEGPDDAFDAFEEIHNMGVQ